MKLEMFKVPKRETLSAWFGTVAWAGFIIIGTLSALALRSDIHLTDDANKFLGVGLAIYMIVALLNIIHTAQVKKQ